MYQQRLRRRAVSLYESGLSCRAVARRLAREGAAAPSPQTIARWARMAGSSRPVGDRRTAAVGENAKRLYNSGLDLEQVGRRIHVGRTTVAKRLREMGTPIRPSGSQFLHVLTKDRLRRSYIDRSIAARSIAAECGCSVGTVYRLIKVYEILRR